MADARCQEEKNGGKAIKFHTEIRTGQYQTRCGNMFVVLRSRYPLFATYGITELAITKPIYNPTFVFSLELHIRCGCRWCTVPGCIGKEEVAVTYTFVLNKRLIAIFNSLLCNISLPSAKSIATIIHEISRTEDDGLTSIIERNESALCCIVA